ncbi:RICIN domain-containing protein [Kitasatospora cinereorecta]|uniref:RICIN domain-containing protein n=1 Tax=Kitasatospora cinereorecta TaxID=285560 RepID=A0ABW0VAE8_9ACTN
MGRRKATSHRRRNSRTLFITVTSVAAGLVASAVGFGVVADALMPPPATVAAQDAVPTPAAGPQHKEAPTPITRIPDSDPSKGMVYSGLTVAAGGDRCVGVFKVSEAGLCTHGPDSPPKGVDIHKNTEPAVAAADKAPVLQGSDTQEPAAADLVKDVPVVVDAQSGTALAPPSPATAGAAQAPAEAAAAAGSTVVCDGDGSTGNRVQVMYVHGPGQDRFAQYLPSFQKWAADTDVIYNASAQETGGVRHVRYVTQPDCTVSVLNVEVPAAALQEFGAMNDALAKQGYQRKDRKYMVFADAQVYCGIGTFAGDERPTQNNLSNFGPSYGRTDSGCWSGSTAAHELGHNLGAVNNSAPNSSKGGHCVDEWDIMCYSDTPYYPQMQIHCPDRSHDDRLDCNHDDYYNTAPKAGSYLTTHWNVADNQFLINGNGSNPNPNPTPTPTPTPTPKPTPTGSTPTPTPTPTNSASPSPTQSATPTPSPTATGSTPTTGPDVTVGQLTPNSVVVSWKQTAGATGYELIFNGRSLATVRATVVRIVGLQPDNQYKLAIVVHGADGKASKPGRTATFKTPASAGPTKPGTPYLMTNTLTGQAADMWGGSTRDGAVLIGYQRTGYANQQWQFEDAGDGYLRIKSVRSGKCLQIGGEPVRGQYVMQQTCGTADSQQWKVSADGSGYRLTAKGSSLVLGSSNRWYYGGWLLELQQPGTTNAGYQNWTIQPAS